MATAAADRLVLDTNVLIAATDEARSDHDGAIAALDEWPASGVELYTSGQILREYLAVVTRPVRQNGLGLRQEAAVANVRALRGRLRLMAENEKVTDKLVEILQAIACAGKQVHDANVVATMLVHGIDTVVTANTDDFARFGRSVRAVAL
jgi:predicted nucleic acid-binding protein